MRFKRVSDLIVFGATGFTGRLVAEHLNSTYGVGEEVAWAIAGRNLGQLAEVRREIGASPTLTLLAADASDPVAMAALVQQAHVVITTVGPYQHQGQALVEACAQAGTDYVDLCGEPGRMAQMIPRLTAPLTQVRGRVRSMKGGMSGDTMAGALANIEAMGQDRALARLMSDLFASTPGVPGPERRGGDAAAYDSMAKSWTGPSMMASIDTKNVHRTNALRGHRWGREFLYEKRMLSGRNTRGEGLAKALACGTRVQNALLGFGPMRALLRHLALPKPGQGPGPRQRAAGSYDLLFIGEAADGRTLRAARSSQLESMLLAPAPQAFSSSTTASQRPWTGQ